MGKYIGENGRNVENDLPGGGGYELVLTTIGSSGAATYDAGTDTLNIPIYTGGGGGTITVADTNTINLSLPASELTADVIISPTLYNITQALSDGVYSTPMYTLTKAQADTAIAGATLTPGQEYKITGVDTTLYGGTDIILKAASPNSFLTAGYGLFYNPKYNQALTDYGIWHNTSSFVASSIVGTFAINEAITNNLGGTATLYGAVEGGRYTITGGTWTGATSITGNTSAATANIASISVTTYPAASTIIYGGKHWTNTSGNPGTATDIKTLSAADWTVIAYNTTDYNAVWDSIEYDYANDLIVKRCDVNGNIVASSKSEVNVWSGVTRVISIFQWGNPYVESTVKGCGHNQIFGGYCDNLNYIACVAHNRIDAKSYFFANRTYGSAFIGNKLSGGAHISSNTIIGGGINNNELSQGNNNNTTTPSNIASNTMSSSWINSNTLMITSAISSNRLSPTSYIYNNQVTGSSQINSNILAASVNMYRNQLYAASTINSNTFGANTYVYHNQLTATSTINSNTNGADCDMWGNVLHTSCQINTNTITGPNSLIYENRMEIGSQINSNTLVSRGIIVRNTLRSSSKINSNAMTGNGTLGGEAFMSNNQLQTGEINSNTINCTSSRHYIASNRLFGDINQEVVIRTSKITGCTVSGTGNIYLRGFDLVNSEVSGIAITSSPDYRNFQINNSVLAFGNTVYTPNMVENLKVDPRNMEFVFPRTFSNAAGSGAIGAVTIPPIPVPIGYFIDQVMVDVGTGLTAGAGAIINFGFATDAPTGALNDTTGLVSTLNSAGVSIIHPVSFTKATAARFISMEVKTAAITAGTATFKIKLSKLT